MPRPRSTVPKYCHHAASDRAFVKIDGKFKWLGKYNSPESHEQYARLARQYVASGPAAALQDARPADGSVTVAQVLAAFLAHAATAYAPEIDAKGRPGRSQAENYKHTLKPVARLYASLPATEFGPNRLRLSKCIIALFNPRMEYLISVGSADECLRVLGSRKHFGLW